MACRFRRYTMPIIEREHIRSDRQENDPSPTKHCGMVVAQRADGQSGTFFLFLGVFLAPHAAALATNT